MRALKWILAIAALTLFNVPAATSQNSTQVGVQKSGENPIYKITINVVERSTTAVNYRHRGGATRLDFRGTPLLPRAHGEAEVEGRKGYIEIKTEMKDLQPASRFGPEFLTYVLWAITPEGRPVNLGEVLLDDNNRGVLDVTTDLQAFGLIVTAEPYFGVTQPSDVVVLENFVRPDTKGIVEQVNAKYELLQRGQYAVNVPPAEQYQLRDPGSKPVSTTARGAVQAAEDARLIALKRQEETGLANERAEAAERQARADRERAEAEQQRAQAEEQQRLEAERRSQAEAERAAAEAQAERTRAEADAAAAKAAREREAAQAEIERANQATEQAKQEQARLRQQLVEQFNRILETRESARGLLVNMSGVWFDVGKATLKPGAREKLSKIAGILAAHPNLKVEVEGHTDSTGSDEVNLVLSEKRADSVRDYLIQQSVNPRSITARGLGSSQPVASNDNVAGRQLNRRVEMIVSGDIIGSPIGPTTSLSNVNAG